MKIAQSKSQPHLQGVISPLRIGFIPVADCAPLLVARELDLFRLHGVQVEFSCEVGWATIREKLLHGQVDAAHAVSGLAFALSLGLDCQPFPVVAPFIFNLHGNAITLSTDLWNRGVRDVATLKKLIKSTHRRFTFAVVSAYSTHNFLLREWLSAGGINPETDLRIVSLPPTQMAPSLKSGLVDGFCVGEPWNSEAVNSGYGWVAATSADLAPLHPEKALLIGSAFAKAHSSQIAAVISALTQACAWCDKMENRPAVARILHESSYFRCKEDVLMRSLAGPFVTGTGREIPADQFHIFHRHNANESTPAKGAWIMHQLLRHQVIPGDREPEALALLPQIWASPMPTILKTPKLKHALT
ncbi:MAG: ABC transporter substrate-binding protein [Verrucomicrobiaceae bacterium]|nr:ABC transporter substrate-binding protein [Verrucomicrobiaceae bacterium]